jgi:hypothetical protein
MLAGVFFEVDICLLLSAVLLITLVRRIHLRVALLGLPVGIRGSVGAVLSVIGAGRIRAAGSFMTLVFRRDRGQLARHCGISFESKNRVRRGNVPGTVPEEPSSLSISSVVSNGGCTMPTNPHPDDPAEGSREVIDRQLERSEHKKGEKAEKKQGSETDQKGAKRGGVGSEEAGRD